jgi:hypothetical protein
MIAEQIEMLEDIFGTGTLTTSDISDYFDVIGAAFRIHIDKERIRDGLWKQYPAEDQCNQIKIKIDRILRSLERISSMPIGQDCSQHTLHMLRENITEELHDIINYAVFAARIVNGRA